jgi:DNA-binding transcriptional LysR family regulator
MEIDDLNLFLRVIDAGSISAAARSLDISVAVASQRLKRLEKDLGVRLLHRTTRRLRVTAEGEVLAERGRSPLQDLESLTCNLRSAAQEISGPLRLSVPASFGRLYISPLLPEFLSLHPRVSLQLNVTDQMLDLTASGLDLAIRIGHLHDSNLVARRLAGNRRVLCASPEYLRRRGVPLHPRDLAQHDCLAMTGPRGAPSPWQLRAPNGRELTIKLTPRIESNYGEVLRDAALAGLGIAMHSTWHVGEDLAAGRLRVVLPDYRLAESAIHAVMPQRRFVLPRVRALVDFLAERFKPAPWESKRSAS